MYTRMKRKNMSKMDYAARAVFLFVLLAFVLSTMFLEPYFEKLQLENTTLNEEITNLEREKDEIVTSSTFLPTLLKFYVKP